MAYYAPSTPSQTSYKPRPYSLPPPPSRPSSYVSSSPSSPNRRPYTHQSRNSATAPFLPYSEPTFSPISAFNPKKITEEALRPKKKKQQTAAPYVHLDFHTNFADAKIVRDDIPCPVGIRTVAVVRWTGVVCRALQALGAGGILVAFIAMRKMEEGTGWMCRVPPGVAMLHTVYSTYNLAGKHRMRTPGSSKMYHLFSSTIDMAVIAFYTLIALLTFRQYQMHPNMQWTTIFSEDPETRRKVVFGVFLTVCGAGGLTLISLGLSIYLIWACWKLLQLPPDMNPFAYDDGTLKQSILSQDEEDDHKEAQKRWSSTTQGTTDSSTPFLPSETRQVPFRETRMSTYTPATPSEGRYRDSYKPLEIDLSDHRPQDWNLDNNLPHHPQPNEWESRSKRSSVLRDGNGNWMPPSQPSSQPPSAPGSPSKSKAPRLSVVNPDIVPPLRLSGSPASSNTTTSPVRSQKSFGTAVMGYDRAALMPEGYKRDGEGARFRKVSAEAH